jgi:hypothetical protein
MTTAQITNRTVKPIIKATDFYPGFKMEEECFSNAIIKDVDQKTTIRKKSNNKSELEQGPLTWPRLKSVKELGYEGFLEEVINPKSGEFYPQKNDGRSIKGTGATYYITDICRIKRADGSDFLYTKGIVYAWNSLGDPITHSISKPEIWTKTNFNYKTEFNDKTKQLEKILQGHSGSETVYTLPFNDENLKSLYERRQNDNLNFIVKDESTEKAVSVKDVNAQKTFELFHKPFEFLFKADYIPAAVKA